MSSKLLDPGSVPLKRRPSGNVWAKLIRVMQGLLGAALVAGLVAVFLPVIRQVQRLEETRAGISRDSDAAQAANRQLTRQFDLLKSNPEYIERIARDRLNLGKPGEIIFRFDPYPKAVPVPPAPAR
jgi:cell division protein DivIC